MKIIGAELRDKAREVPGSNPSSRLGLYFWPPHLRRNEKELEKVQGRTKLFSCWITKSQWGNTECIVAS